MEPGKRGAPDEALFRDFLASFDPTEVLLARDDPSGNIWALEAGDCFRSLPLLIEPRKVVEFWGGVDGFEKVSGREEPHTGMVIAKFAEIPGELTLDVDDPAFGGVLCLPGPGYDHPPDDVKAVLILAHAAGPYTGPYEEGEEPVPS